MRKREHYPSRSLSYGDAVAVWIAVHYPELVRRVASYAADSNTFTRQRIIPGHRLLAGILRPRHILSR